MATNILDQIKGFFGGNIPNQPSQAGSSAALRPSATPKLSLPPVQSFADSLRSAWGGIQQGIQGGIHNVQQGVQNFENNTLPAIDKKVGGVLMNNIYTPTEYIDPNHMFSGGVKPGVTPSIGKFIGGTAEDVMNATIPNTAPLAKGALNVKNALKSAAVMSALPMAIQKLKGEKIDPMTAGISGVMGAFIGSVEPKPMEGLATTELGQARKLLTNFGFTMKDFENPGVLKTKLKEAMKTVNPEKGGDPALYSQFIDAYNKVTSANIDPTWKLPEIGQYMKNLWNKKSKAVTEVPPSTAPEVVPPTVPAIEPPAIPKGMKERGFVSTVKESPTTSPGVVPLVEGSYKISRNNKVLPAVQKYIDQVGLDEAKSRALGGEYSAESSAIAQDLIRRAQNEGRDQDAADIANAISVKATNAGQFNQAFSMWARMSPEGMLKHVAKQFQDAGKQMGPIQKGIRESFGKKLPQLDAETTKTITELMKKARAATTEEEKSGYVRQVFETVNKKLPWNAWDVLDEYRYNNMLSNPLTHLRNVASNLQQTYFTRPATLAASGKPIDAVKYEIGAMGALPRAMVNAFKTFKEGKPIEKLDELDLAKYKPQRLGPILGAPSRALVAADEFFSTLIQSGERARGASDTEAFKTAKYSLFNQDLKPEQQGWLLNKIDDLTRATYGLRRVGLGWFIPFVKVPMNVAKQWIEYSPAGLATLPGASNKQEQFGKVITGSLATLLGAKMAMEGNTTWTAPTDPKQRDYFYASGRKPFSIKIGNKWVPMQTFGTLAFAMALPAAVKYYQDDSRTALTDSQIEKLSQVAMSGLQFWSQQTFVTGLGSFVNIAQGNTDFTLPKTLAYTATQVDPFAGMQRYIATVLDPIFRHPQGVTEQIETGTPLLSTNVDEYTDPYGNPEVRNWTNYVAPYAAGEANPDFEQMYQLRNDQLQNNNYINKMKKEAERSAKDSSLIGVQAAEESNPAMNFWGQDPSQQQSADTGALQPLMQQNIGSLNQSVNPTGGNLKPIAATQDPAQLKASLQEKMFTGKDGISVPKPQQVTGPDSFRLQFLTYNSTIDSLQSRVNSLETSDIPLANKLRYIEENQRKIQLARTERAKLALDPQNKPLFESFLNTKEGADWYKKEAKAVKIAQGGTGKVGRKKKPPKMAKPARVSIKAPRRVSVPKIKASSGKSMSAPKLVLAASRIKAPSAVRLAKLSPMKIRAIKLPKFLLKGL